MKIAAALAGLVAAASAEAEPWLAAGYAAPLAVGAIPAVVPINPHANSGELVEHPNGALTPDTTLSVKLAAADHLTAKAITYATRGPYLGYGLAHGIWKREAEAEAEPWLGYGLGYGYAGLAAPAIAAPLAYHAPLCVNGAWGHGLCKREAEAEAEPWLGYGYGLAVPAVGLPVPAAPLVAHPNGAVTPDYTPAQKLAAADHFAKGGGRVHALPLLAHGIWKREAEAEAKPYYYGGYGGLGYGGLAYGGLGYGYGGYGYLG